MNKSLTKAAIVTFSAAVAFSAATATSDAAKAPKKITVNTVNAVATSVKKKVKLTVAVTPKKANKKVTYSVKNKKIATVNNKGVVVGKKAGKTVITVKSKAGKKSQKVNVTVASKKQALKSLKLAKKNVTTTSTKAAVVKVKFNAKAAAKVKAGKIKANNKKLVVVKKKKVAKLGKVKLNAKKGIVAINVKPVTQGATKVTYTSLFGKKVTAKVTVKDPVAAVSTGAIKATKTNVKSASGSSVDLYDTKTLPATISATVSLAAAGKNELIINKNAMNVLTSSTASAASIYKSFVNSAAGKKVHIGNVTLSFGADAKKGEKTKTVTVTGAGSALDGTFKITVAELNGGAFSMTFDNGTPGYFGTSKVVYVASEKDQVTVYDMAKHVFSFSKTQLGFTAGTVVKAK